MKEEIIRCDVCKKEHNAEYVLPPEWFTIQRTVRYGYGTTEEQHFCSLTCLIAWTATDEAKKA